MHTRRVAVSSAFDENTIREIARGAHRHGLLERRAIRDQSALMWAAELGLKLGAGSETLRRFVTNQHARILSGALPEDVRVSRSAELVRVIGARRRSPMTHDIGNARWKTLFDRSASRVDFGDAEVLISMPGSSLRTFEANRDRRLIFHEIDAHPRTRNELLEKFYGVRRARAEMFPEWFVQRIEAEIEMASSILVPGAVVAEQMLRQGVAASKLLTVPFGVDPDVFRPRPGAGAAADESRSRRLQLVTTGQISLRKGIPFLLEAVRGRNVDLTLVGQVFDARILENLPENVTVAGILTAEQIANLYARCDAFVLPSIEDAFGLVVAEAASAGLQVITTRETGAHELLSPRHTVIDAGDVDQLRGALDSTHTLQHDERLLISDEALSRGSLEWSKYADEVLRAIGAIE
ncbi:MAG: glycosyltransferase family 4 protein [Microbacterium sp.]|uniref:glycosyltransferase family 4 protein n=1 Tax=Microbacterium sp. TaxID=51671 RepID=UPI003BB21F72